MLASGELSDNVSARQFRPPRWVRFVDGISLLLLGGCVLALIGDGFRLAIGDLQLSATSSVRLMLWAGILAAGRHLVHRDNPLPHRVAVYLRRANWTRDVPTIVSVVAATRFTALIIGLLAVALIGTPDGLPGPYTDPWLNLIGKWDAQWYARIAAFGYTWNGNVMEGQPVVFFPAFPLLARFAARVLHLHVLFAGLLVTMVAFTLALFYFLRVARLYVSSSEATTAAWLLATYPFAVYFSVPYTESLFLLATCASFLAFSEERYWRAAPWGLLAGLTRPNGWLIAVPLMMLLVERWPSVRQRFREHVWSIAAAVAAPVAGLLLYSLYLHLRFGDGFAWFRGQAAWGRTLRPLYLILTEPAHYIANRGFGRYLMAAPVEALNTIAALIGLSIVVPLWRRFGPALAAFVATALLPPLMFGGTMSIGRMSSVLFPVFIWLAAVLPAGGVRTAVLVVFCTFQGLISALFFTRQPVF